MDRYLQPSMGMPSTSVEENTVLTCDQARELLHVLDNTREVIESYVEILEEKTGTPSRKKGKSWWGRNCFPAKRRVLYRNITIITVSLQLLNLMILTIIDAWPRKDSAEQTFWNASAPTMIILQVLNLLLIVFASGRLARQVFKQSVNGVFMAQAYLATLLLFAGIYTVTYRLDKKSWRFVNEDLYMNPVQVFVLYAKFLFYSISTATLCGSDNVLPVEWYNCIFAGVQMLLSFCYFASILGSAISPEFIRQKPEPRVRGHTQQLSTQTSSVSITNGHLRQTSHDSTNGQSVGRYLRLNSTSVNEDMNDEISVIQTDKQERRERTLSAVVEIQGKSPKRYNDNNSSGIS